MINALQYEPTCQVKVFNRWGQMVFSSTGYNQPWNGSFNGTALPTDTYFYTIISKDRSYTGSVTIIR
jgi:large repetitive protein